MNPLKIGDTFSLESFKHDKSFHRSWQSNQLLYLDDYVLIGTNNQTEVREAYDKAWRTKERAIFYLDRRYLFNVIILFTASGYYYYCNMASPFSLDEKTVWYIDYDIDIIVQADYSYEIVDEDEFVQNKEKYQYPQLLIEQLKASQTVLEAWIEHGHGPFSQDFIPRWLSKAQEFSHD